MHEYDFFCNYMRVESCRKKEATKILILCGLIAVLLAYSVSAPFVAYVIRLENFEARTIVIDPGHGGEDGGVKGAKSGVEEKTLNLIIANYLGEMLIARGFEVVYTRKNDAMHTFEGVKNNKKRADMFRRGQIVNEAKPLLVVSIHMNFYSLPTRRGAQMFYSGKNDGSKELAQSLQNALNAQINSKEGGRTYGALKAEKYILECSPYPSAIVECGFLSNYADEIALQKPEYQMRMAMVLCCAIEAFLR